jgi:hypothetical protein
LTQKLKDTSLAVLPVVIIVFIMNLTVVSIPWPLMGLFFLGGMLVAIGLALFLVGVDLGITPFGAHLGALIARKNKWFLLIVSGLVLGFFISFAEPGLLILANEIDAISLQMLPSITTLIVVSTGIAIMMVVGFLRIVYNIPLYILLIVFYLLVLVFSLLSTPEFLAIAFDASGATTGVLAVPFILSLSFGISAMKKDSKSSEKDSFGLVAITSVGAILAVLMLSTFFQIPLGGSLTIPDHAIISYAVLLFQSIQESFKAFLPLTIIYIVYSLFVKDLKKSEKRRILFGFVYSFVGLAIFFLGIYGGFMKVGGLIGSQLADGHNDLVLILVGFVLGVVTIIAEPAVYVLTHQIEEVTAGYVKRRSVLIALAVGVGTAVALSMLRIITPSLELWHYLLPGYILSLLLTFIVPKLFVGIAFDAGGVATGPMTATFILALTNGAASTFATADIIRDGFGMIAMVAMMPIISIQLLGLVFKIKTQKKGVTNIDPRT